jgi:CRP/FNR family transcriptional regulator
MPLDQVLHMERITAAEAWTGIADCQSCDIRQAVLFAGLQEEGFNELHQPIDQLRFSPGTEVYQAGEHGRWLYTIRKGLVKLSQYLPDGNQRIVRLLRNTDVLGMEAIFGGPYQHIATAIRSTEVCVLPAAGVKQLLHSNPCLFHALLARWHRALSDADRWITELSTGTAQERVVRLLLWLSEHETGDTCELFSREDLGAALGLTTETVSRTMAKLKRQKLIYEHSQNQFQCDIAKLRRLVAL